MTTFGVVLYGPPASGKDTVTKSLAQASPLFEQYQRIKIGPGRTTGYRMGTTDDLARLEAAGHVIYANNRYGAVYVIDRPELDRIVTRGRIPVVHLGQPEAIDVLTAALPAIRWVVVELWCPREIAADRIESRGTGDLSARLRAWDETPRLSSPDLKIDTACTSPAEAAFRIAESSIARWTAVVPTLHLSRSNGAVDLSATRRYAEIASHTWTDFFLVNGSTTRGDQLTTADRTAVLDVWVDAVGPERLLACAWDQADLAASSSRGVQPIIVMRGLSTPGEALQFLSQLPQHAAIYSHPMFGLPFDPELAELAVNAGCLPAGGKLAKVTLDEIAQIHQNAPGFALWDGSARHIHESLVAGATGIVATPLAALLASSLPAKRIELVQRTIDRVQDELDRLPSRAERRKYLLQQLESVLNNS